MDYMCGRLGDTKGTAFVVTDSSDRAPYPVLAAADGQVISRTLDYVSIEHAGGWSTGYTMGEIRGALRRGEWVRAGDAIGFVTPLPTTKLRAVFFAVRLDGVGLDPFNPVPGLSPGCGLAANHVWTSEAVSQLKYSPMVPLDASFADEPVELAKIEQGYYRNTPTVSSRWISFWTWFRGARAGDEIEISITEPSGQTLVSAKLPVKENHNAEVARIQKQRFFTEWSPGTYIGRYAVRRNGALVYSSEKTLELR